MTTIRIAGCLTLLITGTFFAAYPSADAAVHRRGQPPKAAFGAIAFDRASASYGYSFDLRSSREAKVEALKQCGNPQCEVVLNFRNTCGALASGPRKSGAMTGSTRQEAETKALRKCAEKDCKVLAWACTK